MSIPAREPRPDKVEAVARLKEVLDTGTVILTDYQGLDVKGISDLRRKLRAVGSGYAVVKNTLFRLAVAGTDTEPLAEGLAGPTAVVYTEDPVSAAKVIRDFVKAVKPVTIKSGKVEGHICGAEQIEELSKIPSRPELYAMAVGGLQSPITNLVGSLQSMIRQLVMTLQGVAAKKAA